MNKVYLIHLATFVVGLVVANGNYGYGQQNSQVCDQNAYSRARETVRLELQQAGVSLPYDPRYPQGGGAVATGGLTNAYQGNANQQYSGQMSDNKCRILRQGFDQLVTYTPLCDSVASANFQNSANLIQQARGVLRNSCERNQGWQFATCFKRSELNSCVQRYQYDKQMHQSRLPYPNQPNNALQPIGGVGVGGIQQQQPVTFELCQAYETFRNCVTTNARLYCYSSDFDHTTTYLVDNAQNAAWSCLPSPQLGGGVIGGGGYPQRNDLAYPGQPQQQQPYSPNQSPYGVSPNRYQPPYQVPYQPINTNLQPLPTYNNPNGMNPPVISDRFGSIAISGLLPKEEACLYLVRPYETQCSDLLVKRQREARYGRSSNDVQRRICCALFWYRDCLSRIVIERCPETSRAVVDHLMGDRNREISTNCRDYTREQCSGVLSLLPSGHVLVASLLLVLVTSLKLF